MRHLVALVLSATLGCATVHVRQVAGSDTFQAGPFDTPEDAAAFVARKCPDGATGFTYSTYFHYYRRWVWYRCL